MKLRNRETYVKLLESTVLNAAEGIVEKNGVAVKKLHINDVRAILKKHGWEGRVIAQMSFAGVSLSKPDRDILKAAKVILNAKGVFVYPADILERIKRRDESILVRPKEKDEGKV